MIQRYASEMPHDDGVYCKWEDVYALINEIKRLRAELAAMTEHLDLANRHLGELAHASRSNELMDELNMLRKFFTDYGFNELNEAKRELARYKTPNVDEMEVKP
jgi:hypothetical protein